MFDIRDALLDVTADLQEIMREVMQEIAGPQMVGQLRETWITAPDELKERFKNEHPEEYRALMEAMKGEKK